MIGKLLRSQIRFLTEIISTANKKKLVQNEKLKIWIRVQLLVKKKEIFFFRSGGCYFLLMDGFSF